MLTHSNLTEVSPSAPSAVVVGSKVVDDLDSFSAVSVYLTLRGAAGGPTCITLQVSHDGQKWWDWYRSMDIPAGAAATTVKATSHPGESTATVVGTGTTTTAVPALEKGATAPGLCGRRMRAVFETGPGVTAGALQEIVVVGSCPPA